MALFGGRELDIRKIQQRLYLPVTNCITVAVFSRGQLKMQEAFPPCFKTGKPSLAALQREPRATVGVGEDNKSKQGGKRKGRVMAATSGGAMANLGALALSC